LKKTTSGIIDNANIPIGEIVLQENIMSGIELLAQTEDPQVDQALRGLVGIFETIFPGRIRGYYIIGSYADGTAISTVSDVDGLIVFKNNFLDGVEAGKAWQVLSHCALLTPLDFDLAAVPESNILRYGHVVLKYNSTPIYGQDIREEIPLPDIDIFGQSLLFDAYRFLSRVRGNPPFLTYPLEYPDPHAEYFGYTQSVQNNDRTEQANTKGLINCVGKAALGMVTAQGRVHVKNKTDCIVQYKKLIGDEWGTLLEDIFIKCRNTWHYHVPDNKIQQQELRNHCRRTLDFENHFLSFYKDFLIKTLQDNEQESSVWVDSETANMVFLDETLAQNLSEYGVQIRTRNESKEVLIESPTKIMATRALGQVVDLNDGTIVELLQEKTNSQNLLLGYFAKQSLQRYI